MKSFPWVIISPTRNDPRILKKNHFISSSSFNILSFWFDTVKFSSSYFISPNTRKRCDNRPEVKRFEGPRTSTQEMVDDQINKFIDYEVWNNGYWQGSECLINNINCQFLSPSVNDVLIINVKLGLNVCVGMHHRNVIVLVGASVFRG